MMRTRLTAAAMAVATAVALGLPAAAADMPHDAYVWQRAWTPAVAAAVTAQADLVRSWRVLAGQSNRGGPLKVFVPDWSALQASNRPVIAVIRLDGPRIAGTDDALAAGIAEVVAHWRGAAARNVDPRGAAAGIDGTRGSAALTGVEIDHDSATARLGDYARFLAVLRRHLPPGLRLSVTALPAWLGSPDFDAVAAQADEVVLQVHGVFPAPHPLFDADRALDWARRLGGRLHTPFRLALPTYGLSVRRDGDGSVIAVEAEVPLAAGGVDAVGLRAAPAEVARLLRALAASPPPGLAGIVWFRLPTAQDRRGWNAATLRAVILGLPLRSHLRPLAVAGDRPGLSRLFMVNDGTVEAALPHRVTLPPACAVADGIGGWRLDGTTLRRSAPAVLAGGDRVEIGWARCAPAMEDIHVEAD